MDEQESACVLIKILVDCSQSSQMMIWKCNWMHTLVSGFIVVVVRVGMFKSLTFVPESTMWKHACPKWILCVYSVKPHEVSKHMTSYVDKVNCCKFCNLTYYLKSSVFLFFVFVLFCFFCFVFLFFVLLFLCFPFLGALDKCYIIPQHFPKKSRFFSSIKSVGIGNACMLVLSF